MTTRVHLPDTYDENRTAGTACGLIFGIGPWSSTTDEVITDPEEVSDVNCPDCVS